MANLVFYEKPGCVGNQQQKAWLRQHGVALEVHDLLSKSWTAEDLRSYFGKTPVNRWFNESAPDIKSGVVDTYNCSEAEALVIMLRQPLLIKRPLMALGDIRQAGFEAGPVLNALDVVPSSDQDMQTCPMDESVSACGDPA